MNLMTLKIVSLPLDYKTNSKGKCIKSEKGNRDFFSTIQRLMNSAQKRSFHRTAELPGAGLPLRKGYSFYLESLRKGLLAKGKPLHNISLNSEDLLALKKFLSHCGFSREDVERFLKELLENNPHREINLSQFFLKIAELGPPKTKIHQPITMEPSASPYIESALRDLGLTPKEIGHALSAARIQGGGLDLDKFIIALKKISNSNRKIDLQNTSKPDHLVRAREVVSRQAVFGDATRGNKAKAEQNSAHVISKKPEDIGIQISDKGKAGQISIKDFIAALEQMTGRAGKGNQLPTDVKTTIGQILERVVVTEDKERSIASLLSLSKAKLINLPSKEKITKKGKSVEREGLLSPLKGKGGINTKNGQQRVESPFPSKETKLFSGLDAGQARPPRLSPALRDNGGQGLKMGTTEEGNLVKSETTIKDIAHGIRSSTFSEAINTVKQHPEPVRNFLPAYLIDQVGKQISRSILRGERVIRMQLKPPGLGALRVEIDIKDNILKLGMITENSSVKQLLLSNVHELREALVEQGVKLERLDVQINNDSGQSLANSKEGLKEGQSQGRNGARLEAEDETEDPLSGPWNVVTRDYLLDLVA